MSLFANLFGLLDASIAKEFADYKNELDEIIAREDDILRLLGITPPQLISGVECQMERTKERKLYARVIAPQFELPPHKQFHIRSDKVVTFFDNFERWEELYTGWGLLGVINDRSFRDVWTNRDPFALYRKLSKPERTSDVLVERTGDFASKIRKTENPLKNAKQNSALSSIPALSDDEAFLIHQRVQLYNEATGGEYGDFRHPLQYYKDYYSAARGLPDNILLDLPLAPSRSVWKIKKIKVTPAGEIKAARMVEFFDSLRTSNCFFSFELVRDEMDNVYFRMCYPAESGGEILAKLKLYFPDFEVHPLNTAEESVQYNISWLKRESTYQPLKRLREFQIDPYAHFAGIFDDAPRGSQTCYQIVFAPLSDEAAFRLRKSLTYRQAKCADDFARKLPLWLVCCTVSSTDSAAEKQLNDQVLASLNSSDERFFLLNCSANDDLYPPPLTPYNFSLCDTEELAALAHFPITELPLERLEKASMKNVQPPAAYTIGEARIGESRKRGQIFPVTLPEEVRDRHVYVVGKSGTGKSTLIETIVRRDIEAGHGVAVIDPHGDLIHHLLETMPEHRVSDCILFSPKHFPVSLEILSAESEHEIDLLTDDLITMFRRTSESWGDKMQAILQMSFQTLLRVPGSSFTDITPLLTDENYRSRILSKIDHPQLVSFWQQRYDMRQAEPILIRMDRLTTSGTLRGVLTQNKNSLNFYDVITDGKIFLADLSKGYLGESTSHLLGSIIVSQIQLAAMRQAHLPIEQRVPFSLFVDEVQNFTTSAFSTILSEARKQKLRLTIAHQFVSQLPGDLQKAVFGNVGTLIFFALSPDDLGAARHELGTFEPSDVANLPRYHALCRPATSARDTFSFATDPPPQLPPQNFTQAIIEQTRREYAAPVATNEQPPAVIVQTEENKKTEQNRESRQTVSPQIDHRQPATAAPLLFPTNTEKIMHFLRQTEYLSQPQIIALTELLAPNASTALKKLVETGQIKSLDDRRPKIYFVGKTCNATTHNLLIRDLLVKIYASGFAIRAVKFNEQLSEINPDLAVEFLAEDSTPLLCYFELDRGTEGVAELVKKAERYRQISESNKVCFVFERQSDMQLARTRIGYPFVSFAVLNDFTSLRDEAFYAAGAAAYSTTFFGS